MAERRITRRVTIRDVAAACGVALSTVSNALAGKDIVRPETRALIEVTAARLGYRVSAVARALRTRRTSSVGVLLADIANPTFPEIVRGIEDVLIEHQCKLFLCNTDGSVERQAYYLRGLLDRQVDGLILVSQHTESPVIVPLLASAPPYVLIHRRHRGRKLDYVGTDNTAAITSALAHLHGLGHRRIAFIRGPRESTAVQARFEAYRAFIKRHKLDDDPDLVVQGDYTQETGQRCGDLLLRMARPPTAILAANDMSALGIMDAAAERNVPIPQRLSVVGFDDIFVSALPRIALTTVRQPKREIGAAAAELLLARISAAKSSARPREIIFPAELVVRGTTGPAFERESIANGASRPTRAPRSGAMRPTRRVHS